MKPGTSNGRKRESREEFAARMGKELREEAARRIETGNKEADKVRAEAKRAAKEIRKVASTFDGKRS